MFRKLLGKRGRDRRAVGIGEGLGKYQKLEVAAAMTASLGHDMNKLLQLIHGRCELLLQNDLPPHIEANVQQMRKGAAQASDFLEKLLAFMRGESPTPELIEIDSALKEMKVLLRFACRMNVQLEMDLDASASRVAISRTHFEQLVLNLVINSREASPKRRQLCIRTKAFPLRGVSLRNLALPEGNYVSLEISDHGCGIDSETGVYIFEPFLNTKERGNGAGLGLSIVRQIVNLVGGELQLRSAKDRGTTVRVLLPQASQDFERVEGGRSKCAKSSKHTSSDDSEDMPLLWSTPCMLAMCSAAGRGRR